jgi:hypothetical protein
MTDRGTGSDPWALVPSPTTKEDPMPNPSTIFAVAVTVLAAAAVLGALALAVVWEVCAIRRTIERHRNPPLTDAGFWRQQRALTEPKP